MTQAQPTPAHEHVQRAPTLGDAAQAADAMTDLPEVTESDDLLLDDIGEQLAPAVAALARIAERGQAESAEKDAFGKEMVFLVTQLVALSGQLRHALMSMGGTNFQGLLKQAESVIGQSNGIFAQAMLSRLVTEGRADEEKKKEPCKLCDGKGMPDIGEDGKRFIKPCPECGAEGEAVEEDDCEECAPPAPL